MISDLRTMTLVSIGDIALRQAVSNQTIELHGARALADSIDDWLPRSPLATVPRPPEAMDLEALFRAVTAEAAE